MKYLLVLVVVIAILWYVRSNRRSRPAEPGDKQPLAPPQDMVRCPVCAVHLPRADALPGIDGRLYCCAAHRPRSGD